MTVVDIITKCNTTEPGCVMAGGWTWSRAAIGRVAGTAGTLARFVTGFKREWQDLNDPSHWEEKYQWFEPESEQSAWEWFENQ